MKNIVLGMILGVALVALGGYLFLLSGKMPVATKGPPLPLEKFIVRTAMHAALKNEEDKLSPIDASEANLMAGAKVYLNHCAGCHGLPGQPESKMSRAMFPPAPFLMAPKKGVTDDPIGEIYWKARNGIRLTGMPAFVDILSDEQLWQVSQVLLNANQLPKTASDYLSKAGK